SPLPSTAATFRLVLNQVSARPVNGAPVESRGVAVSCTARPTGRLAAGGLTKTDATRNAALRTAVTGLSQASAASRPVIRVTFRRASRWASLCKDVIMGGSWFDALERECGSRGRRPRGRQGIRDP